MNNSFYEPCSQCRQRMPAQRYGGYGMHTERKESYAPDNLSVKNAVSPLPENTALAMAYVPFQTEFDVYDASAAMKNGTLFPGLNKPFTGVCSRE